MPYHFLILLVHYVHVLMLDMSKFQEQKSFCSCNKDMQYRQIVDNTLCPNGPSIVIGIQRFSFHFDTCCTLTHLDENVPKNNGQTMKTLRALNKKNVSSSLQCFD